MFSFLLSVTLVYILTSIWETFVHWKILHASKRSRLIWKHLGGVFNLLRKAHFSHNVIHHRQTFQSSYYVQFDSEKKKLSLDTKLEAHPNFRIVGDSYGLSISGFWENTVFMAVPLSMAIFIFANLAMEYLWIGLIVSMMPMFLSKYIHPHLHVENPANPKNSKILNYFFKSKFFTYIQMYHYIHHQYPLYNFNLLPGGDYILGVARVLSPKPKRTPGPFHISGYKLIKPFEREDKVE